MLLYKETHALTICVVVCVCLCVHVHVCIGVRQIRENRVEIMKTYDILLLSQVLQSEPLVMKIQNSSQTIFQILCRSSESLPWFKDISDVQVWVNFTLFSIIS